MEVRQGEGWKSRSEDSRLFTLGFQVVHMRVRTMRVEQWLSKCGPETEGVTITWDLAGHAKLGLHPVLLSKKLPTSP